MPDRTVSMSVSFYGHTVKIDPGGVADSLDIGASDADIEEQCREWIREDLFNNPPMYAIDGGFRDLVAAVRRDLAQREIDEADDE